MTAFSDLAPELITNGTKEKIQKNTDGDKLLEMPIRVQCQAPGTEHHERMRGPADILRHPARDFILVTEVDARDIGIEEPRLSTWPHKILIPGKIDATDGYA